MPDFGGFNSHRTLSIALSGVVVVLVPVFTYLAFLGQASAKLVVVAIALPWLVTILGIDSQRMRLNLTPIGIPMLILLLPFARLVFSGGLAEIVVPAGSVGLAVFYLSSLDSGERRHSLARAFPVALPFAILFCLFGLSFLVSTELTAADVNVVINLIFASAYVVLAGVFCSSVQRVRRGVVLLIVVGAMQLPIVVGQAIGVADRLPTSLGLGTVGWGGSLVGRVGAGAAGGLARYPGSFGDVELLAEFSLVCLLLGIGMIVMGLRPPRLSILFALAACVALVGWLTGTRSFLIGAAGGSLLLVAFALQQSGPRVARGARAVLVVVVLGVVIATLVPSSVTSAFLGRFASPAVTHDVGFINRGPLYIAAWGLTDNMPAFGYGANMMRVFQQRWGSPIVSPHSLYMSVLLTAGCLGLAILVWLLLGLVSMSLSCALGRRVGQTELRSLGGILAVVIVCWILNEVKIEFLRQGFYVDLMAFLFGLVSSLFWLSRSPEQARPTAAERDNSFVEAQGGQ